MKKISIIILLALVFSLAFAVAPASACGDCCECCECEAATPGYWKNHPDDWPEYVYGLWVGNTYYPKADILFWLDQPVKGDKSITMFKALVAAKLSIKSCPDVDDCKTWILENGIYPGDGWFADIEVGSGVKASSEAWQKGEYIYWILDDFNNGYLCAESRD